MKNATESKVISAISESIGIPEDAITSGHSLEDLGFTSILAVQLLSKLETLFGTTPAENGIYSMRTVGEIVTYFESKAK